MCVHVPFSFDRKIVLYPKGRNVEYLSLYMKVADSLPPYGWSRFVYFRLALINQVDSKKSIVKGNYLS